MRQIRREHMPRASSGRAIQIIRKEDSAERDARYARAMSSRWLSLAVCLALLAGGLVELSTLHYNGSVALAVASCVACTLAPLLGRRFPGGAAIAASSAVTVYQAVTNDPNGDFVVAATVLAFYYLGRDHPGIGTPRRTSSVVCAALPLFLVASSADHDGIANGLGTWVVLSIAPTAVGLIVRRRQQLLADLAHAADALRRDQLRAADAATALERARVARELHDVVAHHVSVMVIQAGAARTIWDADPKAARTALEQVETAGRRALDDLRQVLGPVRRGQDDSPDRAIDLELIEEMCGSLRGAGVDASLIESSELGALSPQVGQATYRIVQEALTNIARHAPGATATVRLRTGEADIEVEVRDDGGRSRHALHALPSSGHGLVGMRERAAWVGGTVEAGPQTSGGFRVAARLPLRPPRSLAAARTGNTSWLQGGEVAQPADGADSKASRLLAALRQRAMALVMAVLVVALIVTIASPGVSSNGAFGIVTLAVPAYIAGAWLPRNRAALALAIWLGGAALHASLDHDSAARLIGAAVMAAVVFTAGCIMRSQQMLRAELHRRNAILAAQRDERAQAAVINERTRIARDLHFLVAQTITSMVVQAQTARQLASSEAKRACGVAAQLEQSGRDVLTQMRRVLGVLRADRSVPLRPTTAVSRPASLATA